MIGGSSHEKKFLVTGVAGFIGSHLAKTLIDAGHDVTGVDNLSLGRRKMVDDRVDFFECDLADAESLDVIPKKKFDAIFHLAGQSGGELSFTETVFDLDSNAKSVVHLINWMDQMGVSKLLYASSVAVYGEAGSRSKKISETTQPKPTSPYGISKLAGEHYLRVLGGRTSLKTACLRLFNVYGNGQDLGRLNQGMLSIYLSQALEANAVVVKGGLDRVRDFTHVEDAVSAFILLEGVIETGNLVVNVCSGEGTKVSSALKILQQEFDENLEITAGRPTPGDVDYWVGDPARMKALGWEQTVPFEQGFRKMIHHHRNKITTVKRGQGD